MADYIERETVCYLLSGFPKPDGVSDMQWINITQDIIDELEKIPAADVRPERHGQWSKIMIAAKEESAGYHNDDVWFGFQCLECGNVLNKTKYCGNCGTKMDREDGESNG